MAKNLLGKYQTTTEFSSWAGITRNNHLSMIYQISPQKASETIVNLMAFRRGRTFEKFLNGVKTKYFASDEEYTWDVMGSDRQHMLLVEARDENGNVVKAGDPNVGAGTAPFELVFDKDWFFDGEYIVGSMNELYQFRILGDARMEGTNAVYKVELAGGNEIGIPSELLLNGEPFTVEAAYVESEGSREVGGIRHAAPVAMRNEFSHVRIKDKIFGDKINKKIGIGIPVIQHGKQVTTAMWAHVEDMELENQFSDYKNNALLFGRSNRNSNGEYKNVGKSGGVIRTGDGLFAQMEYGNYIPYNTFSLKTIADAIYYLTSGELEPSKRTVVMKTGELGAAQFHEAIQKEVSGWSMFAINADALGVIQKTNSPLHQNALRAGYQFVEYMAPNGVTLKLEVDPCYDDPYRNKIQHPKGGPAFSYRYDIMEIGTPEQPNIFKCEVEGKPEYRGYQSGPFRNPFTGETNNPYASFDEDATVVHKYATLGVCVLDPTRTVSIVPEVLTI